MIGIFSALILGLGFGPDQDPPAQGHPPAAAVPTITDAEALARVRAIHGGAGPWAVVGYRIGERALRDLHLPRQSFALRVVHRSPFEVQYACVADGLQASTGASAGKLNLRLEEVTADRLETLVEDRQTGQVLRFRVKPELAKTILDVPMSRLEAEGKRILQLKDDEIFAVESIRAPRSAPLPAP